MNENLPSSCHTKQAQLLGGLKFSELILGQVNSTSFIQRAWFEQLLPSNCAYISLSVSNSSLWTRGSSDVKPIRRGAAGVPFLLRTAPQRGKCWKYVYLKCSLSTSKSVFTKPSVFEKPSQRHAVKSFCPLSHRYAKISKKSQQVSVKSTTLNLYFFFCRVRIFPCLQRRALEIKVKAVKRIKREIKTKHQNISVIWKHQRMSVYFRV